MLSTGPPDTNEVFHRVADVCSFLNGNLIHDAPAIHDDIVRLFAANLQPLGFLLLTGVVNRQQRQLKAVLLGQLFQCADRLFAVGRVVIDQRDGFAVQITTVLIQQIADRSRGTIPVVGRIIKGVAEHRAIRGRSPAITHCVHRNIVSCGFRDQLICDASG